LAILKASCRYISPSCHYILEELQCRAQIPVKIFGMGRHSGDMLDAEIKSKLLELLRSKTPCSV
jgi:hypothetical protein